MWQVGGSSVCGASHRRRQAPNQDAIRWSVSDGVTLLAVADGHGHAACTRSEIGAELAVESALYVLRGCVKAPEATPHWAARALTQRWRNAVRRHAEKYPLAGEDVLRAYGSTVLAVAATDKFVLYLQLGDGDILIVPESGEVTRPWPRDQRLLGVETTSLAMRNAAVEVRFQSSAERPELILLCTDGYANSFRDDAGFLQVGRDILAGIREDGLGKLERSLAGWLTESSELGSGDDITLGYLHHGK
jgi:serine/threonine protein phosphatase PrpC